MAFSSGLRPVFRWLFAAVLVFAAASPVGMHVAGRALGGVWSASAAASAPGASAPVSARSQLPDPALSPIPFWHTNPDGTPVRLDPCRPVEWVFNPAYEPPEGFESVKAAFDRMSELTGIRFEFAGDVDEPLWPGRHATNSDRYPDRWAPILVGWTPPHPASLLSSGESIATTIVSAAPDPLTAGHETIVSAQVALNADRLLARTPPGTLAPMDSWGSAVLHELGHLVGLDHSEDPGSLMHHRAAVATDFTESDLLALRHLGSEAGCLAEPIRPG